MEIKKYEINGVQFEFVCEYWETYRSWGHEVHLFRNNYEIGSNRVRYYNRTWENYRYQTCMLGAISNVMSDIIADEIEKYKNENKISRFKKGEKQKVIDDVESNNEDYKNLVELRDKVRGNVW